MFSQRAFSMRISSIASLAAVAAIGVTLSGCSEEKAETRETIRPVKVVEVAKAGDGRALDYSGSVKARTEMSLGFRVAGKITERLVNIGDRVKPGDILARIDATDYRLALKTAEANLAAAEKQLETTALSKSRAEQLFDKNITPKSQLEQATLAHDQALSTRDAAASSVDQAKNQVSYTDLKTDQSGIVTAVSADTGQVVGTGIPIVSVAIDGEKEVQIAVPEMDVSQFKPGKIVKASFWSDDSLALDGKVREVAGSADPQSRTFAVRVSLPEDNRVLLGMTAKIEAAAGNAEPLISIPLNAMTERDGKKIVWVVKRDGETVHARDITIADFSDDGVHVTSGLQPGDLVVAAGTQFMSENLKVKLPATAQQSASAATNQILR